MIFMKNWRGRRRRPSRDEAGDGDPTNASLTADADVEEQWPRKRSICQTLRRDAHAKCLVLTLLLFACLVAVAWCRLAQVSRLVVNFQSFPIATRRRVSPCDEGYVYIPVAFLAMLYVVYLVECWHCSTRLSLAYRVEASAVYDHVRRLREAQPVIWWKAVCYHYVRRSRQVTRYRNGDAYTTTQTYYERVNSHATGSCFVYSSCGVRDISRNLVGLERFAAVKLRFSKGFAFADPRAADEFEGQRARFFTSHERLDDYLEMREGLELVGADFQEYMVAFADRPPWYVSQKAFWILSLTLLSWPLRFVIECQTAYVHYQVTKLFGGGGGNNAEEAHAPLIRNATRRHSGGRSSRGSTADSVELERHISDNFTLAPSYSEALLLLPPSNGQSNGPCWRAGTGAPLPDTNGNIPDFTFDANPAPLSIPLNGDDLETEEDEVTFARVSRERRSSLWRWATSRFSWGRSSTGTSWPSASYWSSSRNNLGHRSHHHHSHHLRTRRPSSPFPGSGSRSGGGGGLPVSLSRVSLANGHVVYLVSPLRSNRDSYNSGRGMRRTFTCPQNAGAPEELSPCRSSSPPSTRGRYPFGRASDVPNLDSFHPVGSDLAFFHDPPTATRVPTPSRCCRSRSQDEALNDEAPLPTYEEALRLTTPLLLRESPTSLFGGFPSASVSLQPSSTSFFVRDAATRQQQPQLLANNHSSSSRCSMNAGRRVTRSHTERDFQSHQSATSQQRPVSVQTSSSCLEFREVVDQSNNSSSSTRVLAR